MNVLLANKLAYKVNYLVPHTINYSIRELIIWENKICPQSEKIFFLTRFFFEKEKNGFTYGHKSHHPCAPNKTHNGPTEFASLAPCGLKAFVESLVRWRDVDVDSVPQCLDVQWHLQASPSCGCSPTRGKSASSLCAVP